MQSLDLNINNIESSKFLNKFPQLEELKNCIENNESHDDDSVFNHVMSSLKEYLKFLKSNKNQRVNKYLNEKIDNYSKKDLLFFAILFHDIAKPKVIIANNNVTLCPNHEELGSKMTKEILKKIDMSESERDIVVNIVNYHAVIHKIVRIGNDDIDREFLQFKIKYFSIYLELIILALADIRGSQLIYRNFEKFNFRNKFYTNAIENFK